MKTPQIPKGLHAVYTYDHQRGWTCCSLINKDFKVVSAAFTRYNPKDASDDLWQFNAQFGCRMALVRAIREYKKSIPVKAQIVSEVHNIKYPAIALGA